MTARELAERFDEVFADHELDVTTTLKERRLIAAALRLADSVDKEPKLDRPGHYWIVEDELWTQYRSAAEAAGKEEA